MAMSACWVRKKILAEDIELYSMNTFKVNYVIQLKLIGIDQLIVILKHEQATRF